MASQMEKPVDLSLGRTDFDIPEPIKEEGLRWIKEGFNKYTDTQGIPELRERIKESLQRKRIRFEEVMVTSGVTAGFMLACLALIDPGDEILIPDPWFVMYNYLVQLAGGVPKHVDTYPNFRLREDRIREQLSERTKALVVNTPHNPSGVVYSQEEIEMVVKVAKERDLFIISDEIYEDFVYDGVRHRSPGEFYHKTIVLKGFSKSWGMSGWRIGYAAGPQEVIEAMITLQHYSYVCAPPFAQKAAIKALDFDGQEYIKHYSKKRDLLYEALKDKFRVQKPMGAFYIFPEAPNGDGEGFVRRALAKNLLIVPGGVFSRRKSHFRISFSAPEEDILKGIEILNTLI